jgi:membrane dipeptidase
VDVHRNLGDTHVKRIAELGGVVGVAAAIPMFIDAANPSAERVVDHLEHLIGLAGVDHVGLGPDFIDDYYQQVFGGWPLVPSLNTDVAPAELRRPADLPKLTEVMVRRGFSETDIRKILGANVVRVLRQVMGIRGQL